MEDYYQKKKRATNMVWTAADDYELEPMYLFYDKKDQPALYPNTIQGLAYRCLDQEHIVPFLEGMECGKEQDKFRALAVLILEEAVYIRQVKERPSLRDLREEYAASHLKEMRSPDRYDNMGWERQEILRCRRVLGMDSPDIDRREKQLADDMEHAAALPEKELVAEAKAIFFRYFYYKFTPALKSETTEFVGAGLLITLMSRIMGAQMHSDISLDRNGQGGSSAHPILTFWKHLLSQTTGDEDLEFIEQTFGPCMFPDAQMARIREYWCKGYHSRSQLWYTGMSVSDPRLGDEMSRQMKKNRSFYMANQRAYERDIRHITDHLKHALEEQQEPDVVHLQSGRLDAGKVYRIRAMHDLSVFRRDISFPDPDFTVDLVLDASNSRYKEQEAIAAQAYIIARSLLNLEIPVQVTSFRSLRGFTVLQQMKTYDSSEGAEGIFRYFCVGNNRDGLALQAMHPLMEINGGDKRRRIVLVLTDAVPSDTQKAYVPGTLRRGEDYDSDLAVEDTRNAVNQLRREGARVAAIFWGGRHAVPNLKRIYGDAYIRILNIEQFPDAVIGLLLRILAQIKDQETGT